GVGSDTGDTEVGSDTGVGRVVTITIESWRVDDAAIWEGEVIPVFEAEFPHINVEFNPVSPTDYDAVLDMRLVEGTAGDVITCRPFDVSLGLFERGDLAPLTDLPGIDGFSRVARSAWVTDDGSTPFCVPVASVIHGFIYNRSVFDELGLSEPATEDEFFALLQAIADDGAYEPLAIGTADLWEAATVGFQNIGPNYWKGEEGRLALIDGSGSLTDRVYVDVFATLQRWSEYLPSGARAVRYADAQDLFTLGRALVYPAGSWEIAGFNANADFELGAFRSPTKQVEDDCYISDHTDIALGMNPATVNPDAVREFLSWVASPVFASVYTNALPGFFSLQDTPVVLEDPLAEEFLSWRDECESTIRNSYQMLSRGTPNFENELWIVSAGVLNSDLTPEEATTRLQKGLDSWYTPRNGPTTKPQDLSENNQY
ncbi:MAG: ABC transporter substrate-binding protein, partial [Acidimicrobiaceae bacterium]|nr:ABC transporter substrate-binding protein [Acidimicrobiaceae bacterium]